MLMNAVVGWILFSINLCDENNRVVTYNMRHFHMKLSKNDLIFVICVVEMCYFIIPTVCNNIHTEYSVI